MLDNDLTSYLNNLLPESEDWVKEMEFHAREENIPIMDPLGMNFLMQLVRMNKPNSILEIGTAIGYSALRMSDVAPEAKITTIERDEKRYEQAIHYICKMDKKAKIDVMYGDALEILPSFKGKYFDMIFIDAAKTKYKDFFHFSDPLLKKGGIIISDNVLFRGYVFNSTKTNKRYRNLVRKIDKYNDWIMNHPHYLTSIVPVGDGVAISIKI